MDEGNLLREIEAFRERFDVPETTFGRRAIGDANLIANLREGRELRRATEAKVRTFMREYRAPTDQKVAA